MKTALPLPDRIPHKDEQVDERAWAWGRVHRLMNNCRTYRAAVESHTAAGRLDLAKLRQAHFTADFTEMANLCREHGFPVESIK